MSKLTVDLLDRGSRPRLEPGSLVTALVGTLLIQSARQAGSLSASEPIMVMTDPIAGILIGSTVLAESLNKSPLHLAAMVPALAMICSGVVTLPRSPLAARWRSSAWVSPS